MHYLEIMLFLGVGEQKQTSLVSCQITCLAHNTLSLHEKLLNLYTRFWCKFIPAILILLYPVYFRLNYLCRHDMGSVCATSLYVFIFRTIAHPCGKRCLLNLDLHHVDKDYIPLSTAVHMMFFFSQEILTFMFL